MRLVRFAAFSALAVAALFSAGRAEAVDGGISGTVRDGTGAPIGGAFVEAFAFSGCCDSGSALTGPDGTYTISGLTPDSYRVYASADGYVAEFYDDTLDITQSTPVVVSDGTVTPGIDFALSSGGSISGVVTEDPSGAPIEGAIVDAILAEGCCSFGVAVTAADGTYTIEDLSGTSYLVFASAQGFASEYYDDTTDVSLATAVSVTVGANTPGINLALSSCGSTWPTPAGDDDCDGFMTATEEFVGTVPMVMCATDSTPNNESPDPWPVDFDDDQDVDVFDILAAKPHFNTSPPNPGYSARHDLDADSDVDIFDVLKTKPFFGQSCA
ncbi:MAG: carboxypeptidase regulatory-like domain-containing protein [Armatimonadetes bacterium]|nr:carboxypeptidase regulatory-like domain-containing protein [Armatimonadota bacterium]